MAKFRFHRGSLADSLATEIEVSCLEEIEDILREEKYLLYAPDSLICEFYGHDERLKDYKDTYIVRIEDKGVIGFSNAMLRYIKES